MGWWGYDIMDGDSICDIRDTILEKAKIDLKVYKNTFNIKFNPEDKEKFTKILPKLISNYKKKPKEFLVHDEEDSAFFWQALINIVLTNKLKVDPLQVNFKEYFIYQKLLKEHAATFDSPTERKANLKIFDAKVIKYVKKMLEEFYISKNPNKIKIKML